MPRLFFALQPEPAQRAAIAAALLPVAGSLGARPVPEANLHLTLVFLGEVATEAVPSLRRAVASAASGLVELALSRVDCWEGSGVLCLLPDETAAVQKTQRLAQALVAAARSAGTTPDDKPFRPHVTVARKVSPAASHGRRWPQPLPAPLPFTANGFVLMESTRATEGPRYSVIDAWQPPAGNV